MPSKNPTIQKAFKDGTITKGQYDKLSDGLLLGIIKKKKGGGTKKGEVRKTARKAYEPQASRPQGKRGSSKGRVKGTKEVRHKLGKEAHKRGRPKGGSKVEVKK
tara:strand:- start:1262 stop:1573 length:312 start_codon:yes stop_codon:yes gene_type:complete